MFGWFTDKEKKELETALTKLTLLVDVIPNEYICPITQQIFRDPVICSGNYFMMHIKKKIQ